MREIQLTQGKVALVDDEDFEVLNAHKWFAHHHRYTFYAKRNAKLAARRINGGPAHERMHRVVLERKLGRVLATDEQPDHINGDGLDNRRANLRPATKAQNCHNRHHHIANLSSRYSGVVWDATSGAWMSQIKSRGNRTYLGRYQSENEAALAREFYIAAHPDLQARSNFSERELTL